MTNIQWVTHHGRRVLRGSFSACKSPEEMLATLAEVHAELKKSSEKVALLLDFQGVTPDLAMMAKARELGSDAADKMLKFAVLGVSGAKKTMLNTYVVITRQKNVEPFENEADALAWLTA